MNSYCEYCIECEEKFKSLHEYGDYECKNNHFWHICSIHKVRVIGIREISLNYNTCTCISKQDKYIPDSNKETNEEFAKVNIIEEFLYLLDYKKEENDILKAVDYICLSYFLLENMQGIKEVFRQIE